MFVPPEQRQPRLPPWRPPQPKRRLTKREETVVLWLLCFFLMSTVLGPIGGSSLVEAVWFLLKR